MNNIVKVFRLRKNMYLSILLLTLLVFSNLYSQNNLIDEQFRNLNRISIPSIKNELDDKFLENNIFKNSSNLLLNKQDYMLTSVVDHAIVTRKFGEKKKYTYAYNSNNKMTSMLAENWDGSLWINYNRYTYTYDSNGNKTLELSETWNGQWGNSYRTTYTYDSNGNKTLELSEVWINNQWGNSYRITYTYDFSENMTSFLREKWDRSQWINYYHFTYTYDSNGNKTLELWETWYNSQWINHQRLTYTYDSNGNSTLELKEVWLYDDSQWINSQRYTYTYDSNGNMTLWRDEIWSNNNWILTNSFSNDLQLNDTFGNIYTYMDVGEVNFYYEAHEENLIYDMVVNSGPPVFSRTPTTAQQTLPQYLLNSKEDTITFQFEGKSTDGKVALRVSNTKIATVLPLDLSENVTIQDPDSVTILGFTLFNIGSRNFGKQFNVTKNGPYSIKVAASSNSTFPAPFQIHLAGNVGLPSQRDNRRGTRLDILFNHTAPRPQGIYGKDDGAAQTALFKFANPVEISPYAVAVMAPQLSSGFPLNTAILRAPDPMQPLNITTPTARTPLCGGGEPTGFVIDFTQVPDPAVIPVNLDGSICSVIGKNDGTKYTTTSSLIFDMGSGQEIVNGEGSDFEVYSSDGNYSVAVSNTPYAGTFIPIGSTISEIQKFDLSTTGLTSARFVLITASQSVTLDAIKALNVFIDGVVTDPSTGSKILVGDVGAATITMRRAKAPELEFDPFLELIAPDGSRFGENESGFADETSQDLSDAALLSIDLVQSGFYRFLGKGYHQIPDNQSSGAFFVRLESGGKYDPQDIIVSENDEKNTLPQKTGTINKTRQRDSYLFQWHPGQSVNIVVNAENSKLDPILELYDPEDFLIAANDNFDGREKNSVLQVTLPANSFNGNEALPDPSTYRLVVSAIDSAGEATPNGELTVFQRTVSGGNYDLKVFTGALVPPEPKAPSITNIFPNGVIQGAQDVEILINGNNIADGATVSFNHSGIEVKSVTFINSNQIKIKVDITSTLPIGWYNLTVSNPGGLEKTIPNIFEIRSNFGVVNLNWSPPVSGQLLASPSNLSSQVSGQQSLSEIKRYPQRLVKSLTKSNQFSVAKEFRSKIKSLNSFDIIDEIEPNNNFNIAQVLTGDTTIYVDGFADIADMGDFVFNYVEGDDDVEDWYKVTTKATGLDIDLYYFAADCDLYLFNKPDTSGLVALSSTAGDTVEEWIYDDELPAGTYYIGVSVFDPNPGGQDTTYYALDIYGEFETSSSAKVISYNIYRSTLPNARQTGMLITNVDASATSFKDTPPSRQLIYYQVTAVYSQGESTPSNEASVLITKVAENPNTAIPDDFRLFQNYPNPFNPVTSIEYSIPINFDQSVVNLTVYNLSGSKVKTLINKKQSSGFHQINWNGINEIGQKVTTGMYIYRLQIGSLTEIKKMILMK